MFQLRINGQQVWTSERQVTRIAMQSDRGEIGSAGLAPTDGVIDIFIEEVQPGGPVRLDEIERARDEFVRNTPEGTTVGLPSYAPDTDANKPTQGVPSRDAEAGGPNVGDKPELLANRPEVSPTGSTLNADGAVEEAVVGDGQKSEDDTPSADVSPGNGAADPNATTQTGQNLPPQNPNPFAVPGQPQ